MSTLAKYLGGIIDIVPAIRPVDLQTAQEGDYVSLKNWRRCIVLFHSAIGTAGDDPTITFQQADTNAGGNVKVLTVVDTIYRKQAATNLLAVGTWTKTTQTAASTYTQEDAAEQEALWAIEIRADLLDVANGFDHIRANIGDVGTNAQLGAMYYILCDPTYGNAPENVLSPL